jgi:spore germination protein GerM
MSFRWLIIGVLLVAIAAILSIVTAHPLSPSFSSDGGASSTIVESGKREIMVFFPNTKLDPAISCTKVFPVGRVVDDTPFIMQNALEELLKGPTAEEKKAGYVNEISDKAKLQSVIADEGDVAVDFNPDFNPGGGSCRVTAIRAEITETLKQFPNVRNILITANGKTDVLEP